MFDEAERSGSILFFDDADAQMLARVGIQAKVETSPVNVYLPKARKGVGLVYMKGGKQLYDLLVRQEARSEDRQSGVLVAARHDGAGQRTAAPDDQPVLTHVGGR